ncbi:SusE domain-containing protein [Hymenobacter sp. 15J16-1T3B]|uniref:SusE domain-containing protein n=1 Tax=Hymenobacter sp. 15J16-1T3B TaxID=2886941 RepID=UPI001D126D48|nr:SusE domain-containing protein [Hymenobacter sp. 15J16-1T3B]MCC3159300.1 SusE domain-containing protein [Hymenobacter sp. 15J16-1T3B]
MKNSFFKLVSLGSLLVVVAACEKDEVKVTSDITGTPTLSAASSLPTNGVLTSANAARPGIIYSWTPLTFNNSATTVIPVTYSLEVAKRGSSFANSTTIDLPNKAGANRDTIKVGDLNAALIRAGLTPEVAGEVDVRLRAAYANNMSMVLSTNSLTVAATPYSRELYTFGSLGGLGSGSPFVRETAPRKYDGYIYVPAAPNNTFKFSNTSSASGTVTGIGSLGTPVTAANGVVTVTGSMAAAGSGNDITLPGGRMYRIELDLNTGVNTFKATSTTWGIVGSATTNDGSGWNASKPLTYNTTTKKWEGTINLPGTGSNNEYKFRANDEWTINFGDSPASAPDGVLDYDGANIKLASPGTGYKVSLDLNDAGNYKYTVTR